MACLLVAALTVQTSTSAPSLPLIDREALVYQGAFRVPAEIVNGTSFNYGGTALAFNPSRQSLFLVGHDWQQRVAEISIPQLRPSATVGGLATATMLQPFVDATEGRMKNVGPGTVKIGGLLVLQDLLYVTAYLYYDGAGVQKLSHFVSGLNLSIQGDVRGPYQVGEKAGFVSGYMAQVPAEWQMSIGGPVLTGQCCLAIVSRTSYGPAAFAIDPSKLGEDGPIPATPLVYYTGAHPLGSWGTQNVYFNGSTLIRGLILPRGTRTLLFIGRHGTGPFCYGTGAECSDPSQPSKGTHAYPYEYYVWAYDVLDLVAVRNGRKQPWEVMPYAVWTLDLPFKPRNGAVIINGAAYDPETSRLFISQAFGDDTLPLIHVFIVKIH
jgi:hypothetical protein